eukprot:CAMPEP_0114267016 /NCGR_PEP_ID=MMETSP0058-20121206/24991_1 /TAXON_ID=36894 /ORGANISM="Pyramimonas parkeae, CCMP726" /LENGTH=71 /DNA_ID=CAMNT_0001384681 /DNA_START=728 /DNA_END=943 /DNA_ORIENTATION=+
MVGPRLGANRARGEGGGDLPARRGWVSLPTGLGRFTVYQKLLPLHVPGKINGLAILRATVAAMERCVLNSL